jgi:16S rRNA (uracil1498-N3)-methyltransferase
MPAERYFHHGDLTEGDTICLSGFEHHHLVNVMRNRVNDEVEIINGSGALAKGRIISIQKKRESQIFLESSLQTKAPLQKIHIYQAIPRLNRLDTIVEKCTELGMTDFTLYPGSLSEKKELSEKQKERVLHLAVSAMKQCGSLFLPRIFYGLPIAKWQKMEGNPFFGEIGETSEAFLKALQELENPDKDLSFVIGPESGSTDKEMETLKQLGAKGVSLHDLVLRTDTAPLLVLSVISQWNMIRV